MDKQLSGWRGGCTGNRLRNVKTLLIVLVCLLHVTAQAWDIVSECRLDSVNKRSKILIKGRIFFLRSGEAELELDYIRSNNNRDTISGRLGRCVSSGANCQTTISAFRLNATTSDDVDDSEPAVLSGVGPFGQWTMLTLPVNQRGCARESVELRVVQCVNKNVITANSTCTALDLSELQRGINRTIELETVTLENIRATNALLVETKNSVIARADLIEDSIAVLLRAIVNITTPAPVNVDINATTAEFLSTLDNIIAGAATVVHNNTYITQNITYYVTNHITTYTTGNGTDNSGNCTDNCTISTTNTTTVDTVTTTNTSIVNSTYVVQAGVEYNSSCPPTLNLTELLDTIGLARNSVALSLANISATQDAHTRLLVAQAAEITQTVGDISSVVRVSLMLLQDIRKSLNYTSIGGGAVTPSWSDTWDNSTIVALLTLQQQNSIRLISIENLLQSLDQSRVEAPQPPAPQSWSGILQIFIATAAGSTLLSSILPTVLLCCKKNKPDSVFQL